MNAAYAKKNRLIFRIPILFFAVALGSISAAQDETADTEVDVDRLVQQLASEARFNPRGNRNELDSALKKRLELTRQILEHPDTDEEQRVFALLTRLQTFGIRFAVDQSKDVDELDYLDSFEDTIDEMLEIDDERLNAEATTANATLQTGLYMRDFNPERTAPTVDALVEMMDLAPDVPQFQTALRVLLEQLWKSGNPEPVFSSLRDADQEIAKIPLDQIQGKTDMEKAEFLWARKFAKQRDFTSLKRLANMYELGKGTRVNYSQAARWLTKLSQLGDTDAKVKLGDYYLEGKGYSRNPETAIDFYQEAARAGSRVAQFKLGECYRTGNGVEQSEESWQKWIKSSAFNASRAEVQSVYRSVDFESNADSYQLFYEKLVDQYPDDIYFRNNLAYSLLIAENKDPERALELIDEAIDAAPEGFPGMDSFTDTKAHALLQLERWKEAAKLFESLLDSSIKREKVLEPLIQIYEQLDEPDRAEEYRQQLKGD